jgi:hypothetical protein
MAYPMHPNLKLLSFSSSTLLHNCPRKFQLYRLVKKELAPERESNVHLDFGSLVGYGCQLYLCGLEGQQVWLHMLQVYQRDLNEDILSGNRPAFKTFYHALHAVDKFRTEMIIGELHQYELVTFERDGTSVPAIELSFRIDCGDGFYFRGKLDALLRHKISRRFAVLETKTTTQTRVAESSYRNSAQGIGYSVVVDAIAAQLGEVTDAPYDILYPVYRTREMDWTVFSFPKTAVQRALWLQDILLDKSRLTEYSNVGHFPMYGNNCYSYGRECEYFGSCDMSQQFLIGDIKDVVVIKELTNPPPVAFEFTLEELIAAQVAKLEAPDIGFGDLEDVL